MPAAGNDWGESELKWRKDASMAEDKLPIKDFLEAVEDRLARCSADELRSVLRHLASNVPPRERRRFLENLQPAEETHDVIQRALRQDELLTDIDELAREIRE